MSGHDLSRSRAVLIGTWDYTDLPRKLIDLFDDAEDVALFYFVGHGQSDDRGRLCLGLVETSSEARYRASTSLEFEDVRTALRYSNARTKIVLLDCCFAGLATQQEAVLSGVSVADRAACEGAYTIAAGAEYDVARYEQLTDRAGRPETYFTKCLCDIVRDGIAGHGPTLSVDAIYRQMVTTMRARQLVHPTQANRGTASTFPFARNVALHEPDPLEPDEQCVPGPRPSRMATLLRPRIVVVFLVLLVAAAVTLFVSRPDDTPVDTAQEQIDNLAKPPPLTDLDVPHDSGQPDHDYQQHIECVQTLGSTGTDKASWGQERFDFPRLHALATGQGQTVAVIDTGVNPHPLFQQRLEQGSDYVSSSQPRDCDGHGTGIAGLIAADTGTAREDDFQPADAGPIDSAEWTLQSALRYAVEDADAVVVAAAGDVSGCQGKNNDDPNRPTVIPLPAWFSDYVAAVSRGGRLANFSVRGPWVGVAAPGTESGTAWSDPSRRSPRPCPTNRPSNSR